MQAPSGQQGLSSDSYNCGVHALCWIRFRIQSATKIFAEEKKKLGKVLKRTSLKALARNKRMCHRTAGELELAQLAILYDICRFIDSSKRKEFMSVW